MVNKKRIFRHFYYQSFKSKRRENSTFLPCNRVKPCPVEPYVHSIKKWRESTCDWENFEEIYPIIRQQLPVIFYEPKIIKL